MNNPNDADANEDAARRIQEQIWMEEAAAEAAEDDAAAGAGAGGGGGNNNNNNNNNNNVQEFVRQLLDRQEDNDNDNNNGRGGGNNNNNIDNNDANNDNDNDADDDEDDNDNDDDEDDDEANPRGATDGGIAGEVRDENQLKVTRSLKCPMVLYFETDEDNLDAELGCPHNPILKHKGTAVYVGMDKNTKLSLVFDKYCEFVNSKTPKKNRGKDQHSHGMMMMMDTEEVLTKDLEFLHCALLDSNQTVEASAMMKNDRIKVYRNRTKERSARAEVSRQQRESDRKYFKDLRQLLPNPNPEGMGGGGAGGIARDVVLDCRGKVMDERGFSQNVLATTVRANSVLISKRCKWLGRMIADEREDIRRRAEITVPSDSNINEVKSEDMDMDDENIEEDVLGDGLKSVQSDDEDDIIMAEQAEVQGNDIMNNVAVAGGALMDSAHKVEDDDDEDEDAAQIEAKSKAAKSAGRSHARKSTESHSSSSSSNSVWITLDHSPQAVKLLLEYCYTNRVQSLGHEAFVKASRYPNPRDVGALAAKQGGPVTPFRKHEWPEGGMPTVSLHLALAGIALSEEAHMPRLSLMCEFAASQLVDNKNVIDVLSACQVQQQKTGNRLPLLRKAAMLDCIMANGSAGIDSLYANISFKSNLEERKGLVIPSLLDGTVEVMPTNMDTKDIKRKKEKMRVEKKKMFELNDNSDKNKRIMERIKWRKNEMVNRRMEIAYGPDERALRMPAAPTKNIWRDSYRRDPPPMGGSLGSSQGGGRGTKRKGGSSRSALETAGAGGATGGTRAVRRRNTRKKNNHLA